MKQFTYISYAPPSHSRDIGSRIAEVAGIPLAKPAFIEIDGYFGVTLPADDDRLSRLVDALTKNGIEFSSRIEIKYDSADYDDMKYAAFSILRKPLNKMIDADYDLSSGCDKCGTGANQIGPLGLYAKELEGKCGIVATISGAEFVDECIHNEIVSACPGGNYFVQAIDMKTGEHLPWWQLVPRTCMPKMHNRTPGLIHEGGCDHCGRDGWFNSVSHPLLPTYVRSAVDLRSMAPIVATWEGFGVSRKSSGARGAVSYVAEPAKIISLAVHRIIRRHASRWCALHPVVIEAG